MAAVLLADRSIALSITPRASSPSRARASAGTFYSLSVASTHSSRSRGGCEQRVRRCSSSWCSRIGSCHAELIERCKRAGYAALCLTVDAAVRGKRERELRTGLGVCREALVREHRAASLCTRAGSCRRCRAGSLSMPNLARPAPEHGTGSRMTQYLNEQLDCTMSWKEVRELIDLWGGPFALKGVMRADDARRAADVGATAVIVSNHGGRQLDGAAAPIECAAAHRRRQSAIASKSFSMAASAAASHPESAGARREGLFHRAPLSYTVSRAGGEAGVGAGAGASAKRAHPCHAALRLHGRSQHRQEHRRAPVSNRSSATCAPLDAPAFGVLVTFHCVRADRAVWPARFRLAPAGCRACTAQPCSTVASSTRAAVLARACLMRGPSARDPAERDRRFSRRRACELSASAVRVRRRRCPRARCRCRARAGP